MKLSLYQIDAFANKIFEGNPAAVIPLDNWLPDKTMQSIAQENNLSETAFFCPSDNNYEIRWFTPLCDQEYENTKDIVDIIAYAVSDEGNLLWETYLHEGIWDVGTSITQLSDGGYMVYGLFDAINWGGCC